MTAPAVSVILPAWNAEEFIDQAIDSLIAQSDQDFEVVAVNDGSTDRTGDILDARAASWNAQAATPTPKMRVIHQENKGLAAARNVAIGQARAEWLAMLDADDLWLPEKLARCRAFLADHPDLSIVYTPMTPFDGTTGLDMAGHSKPCHAGQLTGRLFSSIFVHDPAVVFHRRVIETCGGFDESLPVSIGNEFWLRVSTRFEFGLIDEPLARRRWTETSLTRGNRLRGRLTKVAMLERFYHEQGGGEIIPRSQANRRLAKVHYHAGKALLAAGRFRQAARHFARALRYRPGYLKVWPLLILAGLGSPLR